MKFNQKLLFTGTHSFTKKDTGQVFTFYRFLDSDDGKTFDVSPDKTFSPPSGLLPMNSVEASFSLTMTDKGKYLNLLELKIAK